jgi:hypothetical protein
MTIEEVLRFCIVDLGVPPISRRWHEILEESYQRFKDDFAPRGSLRPWRRWNVAVLWLRDKFRRGAGGD